MTHDRIEISIHADLAESWFIESAKWASPVVNEIANNLWRPATVLILADVRLEQFQIIPFDTGRGISKARSIEAASDFLRVLSHRGCKSLIVEDDLRRDTVRNVQCSTSHFMERVFHWTDLRLQSGEAVELLRLGSSEYPLNALVCDLSPEELGLQNGEEMDVVAVRRIVDSVQALIVSCYDAESYVAWLRPGITSGDR